MEVEQFGFLQSRAIRRTASTVFKPTAHESPAGLAVVVSYRSLFLTFPFPHSQYHVCGTNSSGRILEPPPDRGCVRRTSRSKCGCPESLSCPNTPGLAVPLRLVLRTQPRSVPVLLVVVSRWALRPVVPRKPLGKGMEVQ